MIKPIPLANLGDLFSRWHDAPPGTLVSFGSRRMVGEGNTWAPWDDHIIAMCIDGDGTGPCMLSLEPEVRLVMQPPAQGQFRMFRSIIAYSEPAIDVGRTYELAIENLAPINQRQEFVPGDVITTGDELLAFAGVTSQERFVSLSDGQAQWHLVGRPNGNLRIIGKLGILEKKTSAANG